MMQLLVWVAIAWIGGTAAILGSLMLLGSLLLWLVPAQTGIKTVAPQQRLKLLAVALSLALFGLGLLIFVPFPSTAAIAVSNLADLVAAALFASVV